MASSDLYGVQTFVKGHKGKLEQGRFFECKDADEACRTAQQRVDSLNAAGAAAFVRRNCSREFDDGSEPITLAVYGTVPPGVEDRIPF